MITRRHGHFGHHLVWVIAGGAWFGDRWCPAGTHIELPFGAAFGPIIAGNEGTLFLEITDGDFRCWGDQPETFDQAVAARGVTPLPDRPSSSATGSTMRAVTGRRRSRLRPREAAPVQGFSRPAPDRRDAGRRESAACTPAPPPLRVEVWGDSLSGQASSYISFYLGLSGKVTTRLHTFPGTAMCDWFKDMRSELTPAQCRGFSPQAVVIEFQGDAFTPCMKTAGGAPYTGQALVNKYQFDLLASSASSARPTCRSTSSARRFTSSRRPGLHRQCSRRRAVLQASRHLSGGWADPLRRRRSRRRMARRLHRHAAVRAMGNLHRPLARRHQDRGGARGRRRALLPGQGGPRRRGVHHMSGVHGRRRTLRHGDRGTGAARVPPELNQPSLEERVKPGNADSRQ